VGITALCGQPIAKGKKLSINVPVWNQSETTVAGSDLPMSRMQMLEPEASTADATVAAVPRRIK
jgi:hypothetical protein